MLVIKYQILDIKSTIQFLTLAIKISKRGIKKIKNIQLKLLGKHNVFNATAAIAVCLNLGWIKI